jgi:hypothetical protein
MQTHAPNAAQRARAFDFMLLVTYTIREGSEERGYDDWLRRVDNPFFNASPGVFHYSNWKVTGGVNHFAPKTHFDFLGMTDMASLDLVWNGPELNRFRHEWRLLWGVADPTDYAANSQAYLCERVATATMNAGAHVELIPGAAGETRAGWDTWRVMRSLRDTRLGFDGFHVRFGAAPSASAGAGEGGALQGHCIAAPHLTGTDRAQPAP